MPFMDELPSLRADPHRKMELKAKKTNTEVCCLSDAEPPHLSSVTSTCVLLYCPVSLLVQKTREL